MKELVWDRTLSVEVDEIDEDHRRLLQLYNLLGHAVEAGEAQAYLDALLEELVSCTVWHFSHEERLMLRHGYPGLAEHRQEHRELSDSARELQQRLRQAGRPPQQAELEFLEHWLSEHILVADMQLGAFLAGRI
ncbi:MAG TPA: bacteriohemerythrin [Gammaproteobacteria bacterium]